MNEQYSNNSSTHDYSFLNSDKKLWEILKFHLGSIRWRFSNFFSPKKIQSSYKSPHQYFTKTPPINKKSKMNENITYSDNDYSFRNPNKRFWEILKFHLDTIQWRLSNYFTPKNLSFDKSPHQYFAKNIPSIKLKSIKKVDNSCFTKGYTFISAFLTEKARIYGLKPDQTDQLPNKIAIGQTKYRPKPNNNSNNRDQGYSYSSSSP